MKEATGELNLTVIVAISVGILMAFFFGFVWPSLNSNFQQNAQCGKAVCDCSESGMQKALDATGNDNMCYCSQSLEDLKSETNIAYCPFKG